MATSTATTLPDATTFNPLTQNFTLYDQSLQTITIPLAAIQYYAFDALRECIIRASQIGACITTLIFLLLLTKPEKRRLPVFPLNTLALLFSVLGQLFSMLYYTSSWYSPYAYLTEDYTFVTANAKAVAIAAPIFYILVVMALETSLVLQVHVVCITLSSEIRFGITAFSGVVALLPIGFWITQAVQNITYNIIRKEYNDETWLVQARDITLTVSICFFSAVFCGKLGWSLWERRRLGIGAWGPMQVIFVGGAQTMIVPAIFAILQFAAPVLKIDTLILTITVLSLPLTSLWASAVSTNPNASTPNRRPRRFLLPSGTFGSGRSGKGLLSGLSSLLSGKGGVKESEGSVSEGKWGEVRVRESYEVERGGERDMEMQDLKG